MRILALLAAAERVEAACRPPWIKRPRWIQVVKRPGVCLLPERQTRAIEQGGHRVLPYQSSLQEMSLSEERRMEHDLEAIGRQRQEWVEVVNAGDVERYGALLSREAVWIPPGQPALHGREAIRAWLQPFFEAYHYAFTVTDVQMRLAGDWAVERAHFTTEVVPKTGGAARRHGGSYLLLWRRDPGNTWHIERYVDVTEMQQAAEKSPH